MNASSQYQMPTIKSWLDYAKNTLDACGLQTSRLDSELMLTKALGVNRTFIHGHPEANLSKKQNKSLSKMLKLRKKSFPMAYILGSKDFYGREFFVNKYVLIPKPESEIFIEYIKTIASDKSMTLVDIGTGSGCIGISAKLELNKLDVTLLDISAQALSVARNNAAKLGADVSIKKSNLLKNFDRHVDIITANLPYVDKNWEISSDSHFEPKLALFAKNNGLALIIELIKQANSRYLLLESDTRQQDAIIKIAQEAGYRLLEKSKFVMLLEANAYIRAK